MQGCRSPWSRRGPRGPCLSPHSLTDNLIPYLNKGRQITNCPPPGFSDFPTALNMLLSLRGLTDLSLQIILPTIIKQFFCVADE